MTEHADLQVRHFREMLRIRRLEERIEAEYHLDQMKTPVHLCIGQEAVSVGVCAELRRDDYVSSNHRSHGHYLAKGGDMPAMMAELYCRSTGCSRGRGGSMHVVDTAVGLLGSSSIVGGGIPIATGLGLAIQQAGERRVSVVFFGDGAADEGVLYESINFATLWKLPVIFVLENNQLSVCSRQSARQAGPLIFHHAPPDLLSARRVDGNDVQQVHAAAQEAVQRARAGGGPSLLECVTYRMRGHAGAGPDTSLGYRDDAELAAWAARCPVEQQRRRLRQSGALDDAGEAAIEELVSAEIDAAFAYAKAGPLPGPSELHEHLYYGE
jgi:acetoin:2,6-dichlorophenolindophenol oxidoreductase subunit alpha